MNNKKNKTEEKTKIVRSVNKNVRSSTRKLKWKGELKNNVKIKKNS